MSDEVNKFKVLIQHLDKLIRDLEKEDQLSVNLLEAELIKKYQENTVVIVTECLGPDAAPYLGEINKVKRLKPNGILEFSSISLLRLLIRMRKNVFRESELFDQRLQIRRQLIRARNVQNNSPIDSNSTRGTKQTINIIGDVHGDVTQANQSKISKIITVTEGFDRAKDILTNESCLLSQDRDQAIEHLKIIEIESNKISPNKSSVSRSWTWLKSNAPKSVLSVLEKIVAGLLLRSV